MGQANRKQRKRSKRVESLLAQMSVEEKVGQLHMVCSPPIAEEPDREKVLEDVRKGRIGNCAYTGTFQDKCLLQKAAVEDSRLGIPLVFGRDILNGHKTIFPCNLGQAASWDLEAIEQGERIAATEASADGISWTFSPNVDVSNEPRWGRIMEASGEDAFLGAQIGVARVKGVQGDDLARADTMLACLKHFAGYGDVQAGREYHCVDVSDRRMLEYHLPPFKAAVEAGVGSVMPAFNEINGVPSSANADLIKGVLRDEWGFDGVVLSDFEAVLGLKFHGTAANDAEAAAQSFNAGMEIELTSNLFMEQLPELIESGKVSIEDIDHAVLNVLRMKEKLGLFDDPYLYMNEARNTAMLERDINTELSYRLAAESLVLLQNNNNTLPLKTGKKIAVIGELADRNRDFLGWAAGIGKWEHLESLKQALERCNEGGDVTYVKGCEVNSDDRSGFAEAVTATEASDVAVMMLGESWEMCGEACSRSNPSLPGVQTELIKELKKTGKPIILLVMSGRPLILSEESELADSILYVWYPGHEGCHAIVDTLFGKFNPQGKLPVTFPRNVGQIPIHYNMKPGGRPQHAYDEPDFRWCSRYIDVPNSPLYPFGHGLGYSKFVYSELCLSSETMASGETLECTCKLINTGKYDGTEVAQLYIRDVISSITRPVRELKAFKLIALKAGERNAVKFTIDEEMLSFYRRDMSWGTEPGEFEVFVGGSSAAELSARFRLR